MGLIIATYDGCGDSCFKVASWDDEMVVMMVAMRIANCLV
jgi:hypothetical protein